MIERSERTFLPLSEGELDLAELDILYEQAALAPTEQGPMLEVGSFRGLSTSALTLAGGMVVCVDHWRGSPSHEAKFGQRDWLPVFWENMLRTGRSSQVLPIRGSSYDILPCLPTSGFRMVFIDADHEYWPAYHDIREAWRLLKVGGTLVLDDYQGDQSDGVLRACRMLTMEYDGFRVTRVEGTKLGIVRKEVTV